MTNKRSYKKIMTLCLTIALLIPMLVACSKGEEKTSEKERVLRIATTMGYGPDVEWLRDQYTELYEFANPNVKVEFISVYDEKQGEQRDPKEAPYDPTAALEEVMEGSNPPDLVLTDLNQLRNLVQDNHLKKLDPLMKKDKINDKDFVPAVINAVKDAGDNSLYGLAPSFTSSALIYNKKIFADAGVEPPQDGMTWDEAFELAKRVTKKDPKNPIYGFNFSAYLGDDIFNSVMTYAAPLKLQMFDDNAEKMTINTPQWQNVFKKIIDLKNQKVFPEPPNYEMMGAAGKEAGRYDYSAILSGKVAMAIGTINDVNEIINANKTAGNIKNFTPVDWDVVTIPTDPSAPNVGGFMYMNGLAAINTKAQNPDDAWEYIKFVTGERWAKTKSKNYQSFVTRKKYNERRDGLDYNLDAFFKLTPAENLYESKAFREKNIWPVMDIGRQKLQEATEGKKTIEQALKEWETEGNAMLKQLKENPNGPIGVGGKVFAQ